MLSFDTRTVQVGSVKAGSFIAKKEIASTSRIAIRVASLFLFLLLSMAFTVFIISEYKALF